MTTSAANADNRSMDAEGDFDFACDLTHADAVPAMPVTEAEWMFMALHDPDVGLRRLAIRTLCVMRATEVLNAVKP